MEEVQEVEVKFEREGLHGIVAEGTYVADAAKRLGVRFEDACNQVEGVHFCSVTIKSGEDHLSPLTAAETEHFSEGGRKNGERLACQAKIEKPGEVVIMTEEKKEEPKTEAEASEAYVKEFTELPLEKKIASLVKLEAIAIGETLSFVINSPFTIGQKLVDVLAEFGFKAEEKEREAARPAEDKPAEEPAAEETAETVVDSKDDNPEDKDPVKEGV